ncbi:condensation domain-containing protein, partial [Saccharibacillus brassicae]|uniref:condensation domain-containing protein n=1 Tax=Saccharibacillus brassicae TaxID=2583377 RepID=UPI0039E76FA4
MTNNVEKIYALTPMQEGMLYHRLIDEKSSSYFVQNTIRFDQSLDLSAVRDSLLLLTRKHEVLRTSIFYRKIKQPRQIILKERDLGLEHVDLGHLPEQEAQAEFEAVKRADLERGFDLEKDPLMRVTAVKMGAERYKLIWSFHHIIMDGWCMALIVNDFMHNYEKLAGGLPLPRLRADIERDAQHAVTFEHYIKWLGSKNKEAGLRYWNGLLMGVERSSGIEACGSAGRSERQTEQVQLELSVQTCRLLKSATQQLNVTANTLVEAAWGILLQRYNASEDVVFGKVVSGRSPELRGIEQTVGLFINTVPVRVRRAAGETFAGLARQLQDQAAESTAYDYCALPEIQEQTELKSDLLRTLIAFENYYVDEEAQQTGGLSFEVESLEERTHYPLSLVVYLDEVLRLEMMYDPSVYAKAEIELILGRLNAILSQAAERPEIEVDEIALVGPDERGRIVQTFNDTRRPYARESSLQTLFAAQALRTPHAQAVLSRRDALTYAELDACSDALLSALRRAGVQAGERVGILTDKSGLYVAGLLAILKAGCAYVPLTSGDPAERLSALLGDADVSALLHLPGQRDTARAIAGGRPLVELDLSAAADYPPHADLAFGAVSDAASAPPNPGSGEDEAYVLFTSGTTGRPKGVRVRHRSVTRLVQGTGLLDFAQARVLQTGALAFDASTFEIWGPLLSGGSVYLSEPAEVPD